MAKRDLKVLRSHYTVQDFQTEANVHIGMEVGDAVKLGGTGVNFALLVLDGEPTNATDIMLGITKTASSATTAAAGVVKVEIVGPGTVVQGRAHTPANMNTAALLNGFRGDYTKFSRSAATAAGVITINESANTGKATGSLFILDGDIVKGTLNVMMAQGNIFHAA